jgi:hypothetical protein
MVESLSRTVPRGKMADAQVVERNLALYITCTVAR